MSFDSQTTEGKNMRHLQRHYPVLHYAWNNDIGILENVTYTPYTDDEIRNLHRDPAKIGELGRIEGTVRCGGQFSRLFHATSVKPWPIGKIISFDWFTADRDCHETAENEFAYSRCTC